MCKNLLRSDLSPSKKPFAKAKGFFVKSKLIVPKSRNSERKTQNTNKEIAAMGILKGDKSKSAYSKIKSKARDTLRRMRTDESSTDTNGEAFRAIKKLSFIQ